MKAYYNGQTVSIKLNGCRAMVNGENETPEEPDVPVTPEQPETLSAGLYDVNDNLIASWDTLVNDYGLRLQNSSSFLAFNNDASTLYYVLTNYNITNATKFIIGDSITTIGSCTIYNCDTLVSIIVPSTINLLRDYVFGSCNNLKRIDFSTHTSIPTIGKMILNTTHSNLQIKVPANLIDSWKNATNWSEYADKIVTEFTNEV